MNLEEPSSVKSGISVSSRRKQTCLEGRRGTDSQRGGNVAPMMKAGCMQELPLNAVLFSGN